MTSSQEPPLTRRELRERERLREQQETSPTPDAAPAAPAQAVPAAPQPSVPQAPPVQQAPPLQAAPPIQAAPPVQSQPGYAAPRPAGAGADSASPFGGAVVSPAPGDPFASMPTPPSGADLPMTPERTLTRRELRAMLDANSMGEYDELDFGDDTEQHVMPAPQAAPGQAPNGFDPYAQKPTPVRAPAPHQVADAAIADEPLIPPRPVGHWTDQLNAPVDRAEPFDQLLSRGGVSHGVPTTTNALILPTLPDHGSMGGSLAASGETIVTGSVDLPRSFGASGVHPSQIDSSDVDRLFDQVEDGAGVGAPVAATRAISTQNAARAMMAPPKKEGMNAPLVLAVTAGVLALGVVATLVIGALTGLF